MLKDIRDWNLAGNWTNDTSAFIISCKGDFGFYEASTFDNGGMGSLEKNAWIKKLEKNKITVGPKQGLFYLIHKLPELKSQGWVMILNKQEYVRGADFPVCP
jgi:hypothetical protein